MYDGKVTVEQFVEATAGRQPMPAGGAVAGLVGALSAALGEMVVKFSIGKKDLAEFEGELRPVLAELHRARQVMSELMIEDQLAYEALMAAKKLPASDPQRQGKIDAALVASIRVPQTLAATGVAILELCDRVLNFVNRNLLADLAVCADLAMATVRCGIYCVRANSKELSDSADRASVESTTSQLLSQAAKLIQRVAPRVWEREGQGH